MPVPCCYGMDVKQLVVHLNLHERILWVTNTLLHTWLTGHNSTPSWIPISRDIPFMLFSQVPTYSKYVHTHTHTQSYCMNIGILHTLNVCLHLLRVVINIYCNILKHDQNTSFTTFITIFHASMTLLKFLLCESQLTTKTNNLTSYMHAT